MKYRLRMSGLCALLAIYTILVCACATNKDPRIERANPADLKPLPIQRDSLSDEQLGRIRKVHELLAEVNPSPIETWIDNFKRDLDPEKEIKIWERIAEAYTRHVAASDATIGVKRDIFKTLLMCSMGSDEETINALELEVLTLEEARRVCNDL